jgi:hypothetical protein
MNWIHLAKDRGLWWVLVTHGNEPSGSIKGGEFLDKLSDYKLLKNESTPWS